MSIPPPLTEFVSTLISGALAGWVAGTMILRSQFKAQFEVDDRRTLLDMEIQLDKALRAIEVLKSINHFFDRNPDVKQTEHDKATRHGRVVQEAAEAIQECIYLAEGLHSARNVPLKAWLKENLTLDRVWMTPAWQDLPKVIVPIRDKVRGAR